MKFRIERKYMHGQDLLDNLHKKINIVTPFSLGGEKALNIDRTGMVR